MNFAVNQALYDGDTPLDMCRHKGAEHAAYGWASNPRGHWGIAQRAAYMQGYLDHSGSVEPLTPT